MSQRTESTSSVLFVDALLFAQHAIEMFRRSLPGGAPKHRLDQLANRLAKILSETRKLNLAG